jgi:hypothetical protein
MEKKKIAVTSNTPNPEWLFGVNPNAIEAQEKAGQEQLTRSKTEGIIQQLPRKGNPYADVDVMEAYKKMGIEIVGETKGDNLFLDVKLPKGWQLKATDHSMWNNLIDNNGKIVATIFYKAAFYDRESFINFKD